MRGSSPGAYFHRQRAEAERGSTILASMKRSMETAERNLVTYERTGNPAKLKLANQSYENAWEKRGELDKYMPKVAVDMRYELEGLRHKIATAKKQ